MNAKAFTVGVYRPAAQEWDLTVALERSLFLQGDLGLCAGQDVSLTSEKLHEAIRVLQGLMAALGRKGKK